MHYKRAQFQSQLPAAEKVEFKTNRTTRLFLIGKGSIGAGFSSRGDRLLLEMTRGFKIYRTAGFMLGKCRPRLGFLFVKPIAPQSGMNPDPSP